MCADDPVRVFDGFVGEYDLGVLGFTGVMPAATGRPGYAGISLVKPIVRDGESPGRSRR